MNLHEAKIFQIYVITSVLISKSSCSLGHLKSVLHNAINHVHLHQVVVFLPQCSSDLNLLYERNRGKVSRILEYILSHRSSIVVETNNWNKTGEKLHPLLNNPRHASLFVSLLQGESGEEEFSNQMKDNINFIVSLSKRRTRPYFLGVILQHRQLISSKMISSTLREAWASKFLDLSIVQTLTNRQNCVLGLSLHHYNPFSQTQYAECYSLSRDVFPNKLKNMAGFSVKVPVVARPPSINFEKDSRSGLPIHMNGSEYAAIVLLARALNFSVEWDAPGVRSYGEPLPGRKDGLTILDLIVRGEYELGANQVYLHLAFKNKYRQGERSVSTYVDEYCALVPVYHVPTWIIGNEILGIMANALGHVLVVHFLAKALRFETRNWLPHRVVQTLLGNPTPRPPTAGLERIVFVVVLVVSSWGYSGYLYAKLTDVNLLQLDQGPFVHYEDLARSDLRLQMHANHRNMTFYGSSEDDSWLGMLEARIEVVDDIMGCPGRMLVEDNKLACLVDRTVAEAFMANETRSSAQHRARVKIMKPCFWSAPKGCIFSEASPYVIQFNTVIQQIYETGLWMRFSLDNNLGLRGASSRSSRPDRNDDFDTQDKFLRKKLMILWSVGCTVACLAFISEFVVNSVNDRSVNRSAQP